VSFVQNGAVHTLPPAELVFAPKTQKTQGVPINSGARKVLEAWALGRKSEFVFYNYETGKPFVDLKTGFAQPCRKAGIAGVTTRCETRLLPVW